MAIIATALGDALRVQTGVSIASARSELQLKAALEDEPQRGFSSKAATDPLDERVAKFFQFFEFKQFECLNSNSSPYYSETPRFQALFSADFLSLRCIEHSLLHWTKSIADQNQLGSLIDRFASERESEDLWL